VVRHWMANTGCSLLLYRALPPVVIEFFTPKRQQAGHNLTLELFAKIKICR
jgi:hypothetical protein